MAGMLCLALHTASRAMTGRYRELLERFPYLETVKRPRPKGN